MAFWDLCGSGSIVATGGHHSHHSELSATNTAVWRKLHTGGHGPYNVIPQPCGPHCCPGTARFAQIWLARDHTIPRRHKEGESVAVVAFARRISKVRFGVIPDPLLPPVCPSALELVCLTARIGSELRSLLLILFCNPLQICIASPCDCLPPPCPLSRSTRPLSSRSWAGSKFSPSFYALWDTTNIALLVEVYYGGI